MSTRATITVRMNDGNNLSFYKHHDGYINGGLGEALMNYVSVRDLEKEPFTKYSFIDFVTESEVVNPIGFDKIETIKSESFLGDEHKLHGDTEYHYTIRKNKNSGRVFLYVQKRDYNDMEQNEANSSNGHWTDVAPFELIGISGILFTHKLAS